MPAEFRLPAPVRAPHLFAPPIVWMAMIFMGSETPGGDIPWIFKVIPYTDKIVHTGEYAFLGLLVARVAMRLRPLGLRQLMTLCAVFTLVFGITDEFHQSFVPGRSVSLADLTADTLGGSLGAVTWHLGHLWGRLPAWW